MAASRSSGASAEPGHHPASDPSGAPRVTGSGRVARLVRDLGAGELKRSHFALTAAVLVLAPLPFGSVDPSWAVVWGAMLASASLLAPGAALKGGRSTWTVAILGTAFLYGAWAVIQVLPLPPGSAGHEVWQRAASVIGGDIPERLSARAYLPAVPLLHGAVLALACVNGLMIGADADRAVRLLKALAYSGAAYAAYGLLAQAFTPHMLLWRERTAYIGDVTGPFVGRSAAAAYFGACSLVWLGLAFRRLSALDLARLPSALLVDPPVAALLQIGIRVSGFVLCLAAALGTHSRAGSALTILFSLFVAWRESAHLRIRRSLRYGGAGLVGALVLFLLPSAASRISSEGLVEPYRLATYAASLDIVRRHPLAGSGLGTFPDVFPAFRTDEVSSLGTWDRAHSTPLEIAVEMGLPVAALVGMVALSALVALLRARPSRRAERGIPSICAGVCCLAFAYSVIDYPLQILGSGVVIATVLGLGLGVAADQPDLQGRVRD